MICVIRICLCFAEVLTRACVYWKRLPVEVCISTIPANVQKILVPLKGCCTEKGDNIYSPCFVFILN